MTPGNEPDQMRMAPSVSETSGRKLRVAFCHPDLGIGETIASVANVVAHNHAQEIVLEMCTLAREAHGTSERKYQWRFPSLYIRTVPLSSPSLPHVLTRSVPIPSSPSLSPPVFPYPPLSHQAGQSASWWTPPPSLRAAAIRWSSSRRTTTETDASRKLWTVGTAATRNDPSHAVQAMQCDAFYPLISSPVVSSHLVPCHHGVC